MAKKFQLSIPEPCHEDWDKMHPSEKGRFCDSCQKQVVDFSNMSDMEIAQFFKKPSTGSLCGRFMGDQLERTIEMPKKRIPWVKYFFQIALPAFLTTAKASAQGEVKVNTVKESVQKGQDKIDCPKPLGEETGIGQSRVPKTLVQKLSEHKTISLSEGLTGRLGGLVIRSAAKIKSPINGKVADDKGNPVPFATVFVEELDKTIMADEQGLFIVNPKKKWDRLELTVTSSGFIQEKVIVNSAVAKEDTIYIDLKANDLLPEVKIFAYPMLRGRVVVGGSVSYTMQKVTFLDTVKNFFTKKAMPTVYPNPVEAGASLNIATGEQEEGMYVFDLISANGQSVQKRELWIDKDARVLNFEVPAVAAGVYFLRMQHKQTGKAITEKVVVK